MDPCKIPNAAEISRIEVLAYPRAPNKRAAFSINSARLSTIKPPALSFIFVFEALMLLVDFFALGAILGNVFISVGKSIDRILNAQ